MRWRPNPAQGTLVGPVARNLLAPRQSTSRDKQGRCLRTKAGHADRDADRCGRAGRAAAALGAGQAKLSWGRSVGFSSGLGTGSKDRHQTPISALVCGGRNVPSVRVVSM